MLLNGDKIQVAQLGPGFVLLDHPVDHFPCEATIVLRVDESERRCNVRLPDGISAGSKRVAITKA